MANIDWHNKPIDEIFDHYDKLTARESIDFLMNLLKDYPELEIDWVELLEEVIDDLVFDNEVDKIEEFLELYVKKFPEDYSNGYPYIEKALINYYLYKGDKERVLKRLEIVKVNPVVGIDSITIVALNQLIFHGYYSEAINYAKAVWKPIYESEELFGQPYFVFTNIIYIHELEKIYMDIRQGTLVDWDAFSVKMGAYEIEEEEEIKEIVKNVFSNTLDKETLKIHIDIKDENCKFYLYLEFLKFMRGRFDLPFIFSHCLWEKLLKTDLFGREGNDPNAYFYISFTNLKEYFSQNFNVIFHHVDVKTFGQAWGLPYVCLFLHEYGLINQHYYDLMKENVSALKYYFINAIRENLWIMTFLKDWPQLSFHDQNEIEVILSTFPADENIDDDDDDKLDVYLESTVIPERIRMELHPSSKNRNRPFYTKSEPYVKTVDVGRNEPCPCGSGKKYKKCCL